MSMLTRVAVWMGVAATHQSFEFDFDLCFFMNIQTLRSVFYWPITKVLKGSLARECSMRPSLHGFPLNW